MEHPRNPFVLGHKIRRPYFCDRMEEQKKLASAIINGRNVVLISPRRMGKTSLAYVALHEEIEIVEDYITIFIDILQTNSIKEFTYLLGKAIFEKLSKRNSALLHGFIAALKSLKGSFGFDNITGTPTFDLQIGEIQLPEYTLDEIFRYMENSPKPIVVVIDEFQQIAFYPEQNTEAILRSHTQKLSNVSFVFSGSERTILREMFTSSKRPFYNSAEIMHLGPIAEDYYVEFAMNMFSCRDRQIEEEAVRSVFRLFEGNTFYLQRTMNGAFAETPRGEKCNSERVKKTIREMLASNGVVYREMLSNVSAHQKLTLYAIANERIVANPLSSSFIKRHHLSSASSVQSALQKLMKAGYISREEDGYVLTDPLLRIFINDIYSLPEI